MRTFVMVAVVLAGSSAMAQEPLRPLFDFPTAEAARSWQAVNDGVMGGVSEGRLAITGERTLAFTGRLSLENNGGFASVRTRPAKLDILPGDTLVVRVRGDGREYLVNLYTTARRMAFSYRTSIATEKDVWQEFHVPLDRFEPTSFGRVVAGMGPIDAATINGLGFMLSDKKPGPFRLEVDWVKVLRVAE